VKILCTMPGRYGDIFWSLASVRTIAEQYNTTVDFACSPKYAACLPIVEQQWYVGRAFEIPVWEVQETAPITPAEPPFGGPEYYDHVFHFGYKHWPQMPLALQIAEQHSIPLTLEDLGQPWITVKGYGQPGGIVAGFTDEYFELKVGIVQLLLTAGFEIQTLASRHSRWIEESLPDWKDERATDLPAAAMYIQSCGVFLGCLSSLAVLAAAMGKPRVLVEPNPQRHHPIFQHWDTPLVTGSDGLPTFDARHVANAVNAKLVALS
jgi:hypothetical protein